MSNNKELDELKLIVQRLGKKARADSKDLHQRGLSNYAQGKMYKSEAFADVVSRITKMQNAMIRSDK